ncbi:DUF6527 family protein [Brevibacillus centrosporus]|uniref:DUF6527 family protein n=1 Tax=Brevibacillus centrosporus TaxID=54910 RepID=UPI002E21A3FC|nr:DUF6527 family protein [Brevibacillus centrosporus]
MRKVRRNDEGWLVFGCPGCGCMHYADQRWTYNGDEEKPTFSPSINVKVGHHPDPPDICHFFVRDGRIEYLSDCTHSLAGQTVELPDIDEF